MTSRISTTTLRAALRQSHPGIAVSQDGRIIVRHTSLDVEFWTGDRWEAWLTTDEIIRARTLRDLCATLVDAGEHNPDAPRWVADNRRAEERLRAAIFGIRFPLDQE